MNNDFFKSKLKPLLNYIGFFGAILSSIAYIILIFTLIRGFQFQLIKQVVTFAIINAIVGIIICNFLRVQGVQFGKMENKEIVKKYYNTDTKDKKPHSMVYFWIKHILLDFLFKGISVTILTTGLIYIVIVGNQDYNMLWLALVNLIMFICFGFLAMNSAYEYFNNSFIPYMNEKIKERENNNDKIQ